MTDEIVRTLQHYARKDEPKSVEARLNSLEFSRGIQADTISMLSELNESLEKQILELSNRIERMEECR